MKRTSAKVLMSTLIILLMIPFSFIKTYASIGYDFFRVVSTIDVGTGIGSQLDFYFNPEFICNGTIKIKVNPNFAITSDAFAYAMLESDGASLTATDIGHSGSAVNYEFTFTLNNCSYFHFMVQHQDASFWTTQKISSYWTYWGSFSPTTTMNVSYTGTRTNQTYILSRMLYYLQNGGSGGNVIDLTAIETDLDTIILHQETIEDKLDDIIELIGVTSGSQTDDAINDNDQMNEDTTEIINDYIDLESTFTSDFTDSQEEMTTILQNTSLTQFSNALIWFTTQLTGIYNSLGDMKILVQLPLILGIALFVIGRGAVIFREPITERETTTQTYLGNGKWSKPKTTVSRTAKRRTK